MDIYWYIQWLLYKFCVLLPFIIWFIYEALCFKNLLNAWNRHPEGLAQRVKSACNGDSFLMSLVLGMWHFVGPLMLTRYMAPEHFGYCTVPAFVCWLVYSIVICRNAGVFSMQLESLQSELCQYNRFLELFSHTKRKEEIERLFALMILCIEDKNSFKAVCTVPLVFFKIYPQITKDMNDKNKAIAQQQKQNNSRNSHNPEMLFKLTQELERLTDIETTLYTFKFVLLTAVPMRLLFVMCHYCVVALALCGYHNFIFYVYEAPRHARVVAIVAKRQRERASMKPKAAATSLF